MKYRAAGVLEIQFSFTSMGFGNRRDNRQPEASPRLAGTGHLSKKFEHPLG